MKAETSIVLAEGRYEWGETSPSTAVIEALAAVENVPAPSLSDVLQGPLYEYVDPDALDSFVRESGDVTVSLMIDSYCVRIEGDRLTVRE